MTKVRKILFVLTCLFLTVFLFVSCASKEQTAQDNGGLSEEEINSRYEEIIKNEAEGKLPEGYNPITDSFTTVDFQLTKTDDTTAFNLPENSFATVTEFSANFSFLDSSLPKDSFEGSFKTAKGISLANTVSEFLASYKLENKDILAKTADEIYITYGEANDADRLSFGFVSKDGLEFSPLSSDKLLNILLTRGDAVTMSDEAIQKIVGENQTVAIVDVVPKADGVISMFTITRFDNKEKSE